MPQAATTATTAPAAKAGSAEERAARKTMARIDKQLARLAEREAALNADAEVHAQDYEKLAEIGTALADLAAERDALELEWLEAAEQLS